MRDPSDNSIKAWAKEYEETPFFFEEALRDERRLVAWSEEPEQIKSAFYAIVSLLPDTVAVLLKIMVERHPDGNQKWSRFVGNVDRSLLTNVIKENEVYVFSDGMHQLCVKDPICDHYLAFDEHGIFFVYSPTETDREVFSSNGFEPRHAEPLYSISHYQTAPVNSEALEMKFVAELGLAKANSDLD